MKIIFTDGNAFLELFPNYLFFIGSEKFIRELSAKERLDLVNAIMLEIKFGKKTALLMSPMSKLVH